MHEPNFFIIGAPKCGTTAMSEYLRTHPNIFVTVPKEPQYFSSDIAPSLYKDLDEYMTLFRRTKSRHKAIGEASTRYLRSHIAIPTIKKMFPDAGIVVMLRNPVDLVYSFYGQLRKHSMEPIKSFELAWELQDVRIRSEPLPRRTPPSSVQYRTVGLLGEQVRRLLSIVPREQVHFILFEDFRMQPSVAYANLLEFLEVPHDGRSSFPKVNTNVQYKQQWLAELALGLHRSLTRPLNFFQRATGLQGTGLLRTLDHFNARPALRPSLSPEFRKHLYDTFREDIDLLEELLGRDLSAWRVVD